MRISHNLLIFFEIYTTQSISKSIIKGAETFKTTISGVSLTDEATVWMS